MSNARCEKTKNITMEVQGVQTRAFNVPEPPFHSLINQKVQTLFCIFSVISNDDIIIYTYCNKYVINDKCCDAENYSNPLLRNRAKEEKTNKYLIIDEN